LREIIVSQKETLLEPESQIASAIFEHSSALIIVLDRQGKITHFNRTCETLTNYTFAEVKDRAFWELFALPDAVELVREEFQRICAGNFPSQSENVWCDRSGNCYRILWSNTAVCDRTGKVEAVICTGISLGASKLAQECEIHQIAAIEAAIDGIAILDREGKFTYLNQAHTFMFGYDSAEQLLDKTWKELYYPEEVARFESDVFPQLICDRHWQGEAVGKKKDGSTFAEEVSLTLLDDNSLICVCRDISDRKQAEIQLKTSLQEKEVLLKEVHHRVKNNLQVIDSLFRHQCRHSKDRLVLQVLKECQNRVASMALLHEKLYQSVDLTNIDFAGYVQNLIFNLLNSYSNSENLPQLHIDIPSISLDLETSLACGLIINELFSNALKYAFPNYETGKIEVIFTVDSQTNCTLIVRDNGIGLPTNFDLQKSNSLGLKLVNSFTRQLNAKIEVNCQQGTEFKISF
jgi:PAS domain S-box-containing protein